MPIKKIERQFIRKRANKHCEYCKRSDAIVGRELEIDHVKPEASGGTDDLANLAYACHDCNQIKSDREKCPDPLTKQSTAFFNPRTQIWKEHFEWSDDKTILIGLTAEGRATISCLQLNT